MLSQCIQQNPNVNSIANGLPSGRGVVTPRLATQHFPSLGHGGSLCSSTRTGLPPFDERSVVRFPHPLGDDTPPSPTSVYSSVSSLTETDTQSSLQTPVVDVPSVTAIAHPHETSITSFMLQSEDHHDNSHDILHTSVSSGNAKLFDICTQGKDGTSQLIHLPILSPDGVPPQECAALPHTPSPPGKPSLTGLYDESSPYPSSPCRARRFACDFRHAELSPSTKPRPLVISGRSDISSPITDSSFPSPTTHEFPTSPGTIHVTLDTKTDEDTEVVRKFLREWSERKGILLQRPNRAEQGDYGGTLPSLRPLKANTNDEFSWVAEGCDFDDDCSSVYSAECSALLREVSLMIGITDFDGCSPRGSPLPEISRVDHNRFTIASNDSSFLTPPKKPSTVLGPRFPNLPIRAPKTLSHPVPPLTYARLASRPADYPRVTSVYRGPEANFVKNNQNLRGFPDDIREPAVPQKLDTNPVIRERVSEKVGHKAGDRMAAHSKVTANIHEVSLNLHASVPQPVVLPVVRNSALYRLDSSLSKLKTHSPYEHHKLRSDTKASTRPRKNTEMVRRRPAFPPVIIPVGNMTSQNAAGQTIPVKRGVRSPRPVPGLLKQSKSNGNDTARIALPATAPPRQRRGYSSGGPVKSFMDMDTSTSRRRWPHSISSRSLLSINKGKKLATYATRIFKKIFSWGKGDIDHY
ncbi:hypothetical protein V8B97DRAFT_2003559 [Scleroderma yunnanense]